MSGEFAFGYEWGGDWGRELGGGELEKLTLLVCYISRLCRELGGAEGRGVKGGGIKLILESLEEAL